jgi:hypothetical protein
MMLMSPSKAHRSLPRYPKGVGVGRSGCQVDVGMSLFDAVVVVDVDRPVDADLAPSRLVQHLMGDGEHRRAVRHGVVLAPDHVAQIRTAGAAVDQQVVQVGVGRVDAAQAHLPLRQTVVVVGDDLADMAASRVDNDPEGVLVVGAQLDEVVAAAERAELASRRRIDMRA